MSIVHLTTDDLDIHTMTIVCDGTGEGPWILTLGVLVLDDDDRLLPEGGTIDWDLRITQLSAYEATRLANSIANHGLSLHFTEDGVLEPGQKFEGHAVTVVES